jgi:outer membrane immunogenic protein
MGPPDTLTSENFVLASRQGADCDLQEGLLLYSLRTISVSACLMAAVLMFPCEQAAAGLPAPLNPAFGSNAANASSWLAGAHAGYNWQQGTLVYGFETDLQGTNLNSSMSGGLTHSSPIAPPGDFASTSASINYYGTLRGRLGVTTVQWMFFGTAGAAYGNVDLSSTFRTLGLQTLSQTSEPRIGWVAGAGVEYLLKPNVMLTFGYQYVDLGRVGISSTTTGFRGPFAVTLGQAASDHAQFQAVTVGMSWRFAPNGSPSPWAGGYAGGQAGGAWGNNASALYTSSSSQIINVSDVRLKRDIVLVGRRGDGLGIYRFRYLWSETVYVGVMAQEVALLHPDAVVRDDLTGYMAVNYTRLGLQPVILR